eukprot:763010-Hanusia_phi.AAC.2
MDKRSCSALTSAPRSSTAPTPSLTFFTPSTSPPAGGSGPFKEATRASSMPTLVLYRAFMPSMAV